MSRARSGLSVGLASRVCCRSFLMRAFMAVLSPVVSAAAADVEAHFVEGGLDGGDPFFRGNLELAEPGVLADPAGLLEAAGVIRQKTDAPDPAAGPEPGDRPPDVVVVVVDAGDERDADPDLAAGLDEALEVLEDRHVRNAG